MPTTSDSFMSGGHRPGWGAVVKFIVPLAVSVGLCWIMFHNIDFNEMMKVIRHDCDFRWIGLMLAMSVAPMLLRALRWNIQLRTIGVNAPVHALVYSIIGCYSLNLVFPRLGEVWRTGYIAYREDTRFSTVFGSMIADRFADFVTVCIITAGTFFLARGPIVSFVHTYPDVYRKIIHILSSPWIWASLLVITAAVWILFARSKSAVVAKIKGFMHGLWGGFATIGKMKEKWTWLGLTFAIWGCYYLQMVVAFNAFPLLRETLDASGAIVTLVCFVLTSIAMGVPSNGGIGPLPDHPPVRAEHLPARPAAGTRRLGHGGRKRRTVPPHRSGIRQSAHRLADSPADSARPYSLHPRDTRQKTRYAAEFPREFEVIV